MSSDLVRDALATAGVDESALGSVETLAFPAATVDEARAPLRAGARTEDPLAVRSGVLDAIGLAASFDPAAHVFAMSAAPLDFRIQPGTGTTTEGATVRTDSPSAFVISTPDGSPIATGAVRAGGVQLRVLHAWPAPPLRTWRAAAGEAEWSLLAAGTDPGELARWDAAVVAGRLARLWRAPGEGRAAFAAMSSGARDSSPLVNARIWARGLKGLQRGAIERFASVEAGRLAVQLTRLRDMLDASDPGMAAQWRALCARRDDLEGLRVLLRDSDCDCGAELAELLATVDALGRAIRFSWPTELDVHDARLQRVSEMEPTAWWGSTRYAVML
jgi:hypothetical protein